MKKYKDYKSNDQTIDHDDEYCWVRLFSLSYIGSLKPLWLKIVDINKSFRIMIEIKKKYIFIIYNNYHYNKNYKWD